MGYSNFNMRLDDSLRNNAYPVLEKYGLTPSQAVRMFFNQIAETGKVPLSFDWAATKLSKNGEQMLRESIADFKNGDYTTYDSLEELNQAMADIARD